MERVTTVAVGTLATLVIANVWVSFQVWRADEYTRKQALLQLVIIWLVPVVGAALIGGVLYSERRRADVSDRSELERDEKATCLETKFIPGHSSADHAP